MPPASTATATTIKPRGRHQRRRNTLCPKCGWREFDDSLITFNDGTTHLRIDCSRCHAFVKWGRPKRRRNPADIAYPKHASEFEIQATLFHGLKALGLDARGEVSHRRSRFDLVVFTAPSRKAKRIIEVKALTLEAVNRKRRGPRILKNRDRQIAKYTSTGIPVDVVAGMENARRYLAEVQAHGFPEEPIVLV